MGEMVKLLQAPGDGAMVSLVGDHGWGKSTVLEFLATHRSGKSLIVDGDVLLQFSYLMKKQRPLNTVIDRTDDVFGYIEERGVHPYDLETRRYELENRLYDGGWLNHIDLTTGFPCLGSYRHFVVIPDYVMYEKRLRDRIKHASAGATRASTPKILSYPEFQAKVEDLWANSRAIGAIPNLGPDCNRIWGQWWDSLISNKGRK